MTNFIFKSQGLIKNVDNKLGMILTELRHSRSDNVQILFLLNKLLTAKALQKQVDDYYGPKDWEKDITEASVVHPEDESDND